MGEMLLASQEAMALNGWLLTAAVGMTACAQGTSPSPATAESAHQSSAVASQPSSQSGPTPLAEDDVPEQLAVGDITPAIAAANAAIKAECWQPALDARTKDPPNPLRIIARMRVEPSGVVSNVDVEEAPPELPSLSACIASKVRSIHFRSARKPTVVDIPFVFATR